MRCIEFVLLYRHAKFFDNCLNLPKAWTNSSACSGFGHSCSISNDHYTILEWFLDCTTRNRSTVPCNFLHSRESFFPKRVRNQSIVILFYTLASQILCSAPKAYPVCVITTRDDPSKQSGSYVFSSVHFQPIVFSA